MRLKPHNEIKNDLLPLPSTGNKLEYCGPIDAQLSNSFLTMVCDFMDKSLETNRKRSKQVFTAFVELVQNISEYYEEAYPSETKEAKINFLNNRTEVVMSTLSQIEINDLETFQARLNGLVSMNSEELEEARRLALLEGKSLGFIMIQMMEKAELNWKVYNEEGQTWFAIELSMEI